MAEDIPNLTPILSDIEILARLVAEPEDEKRIFVSPLIDPKTQLGPSSLDLRLGFDLVGTRALQATHIDLTGCEARRILGEQKRRYFERQRLHPGGNFVLHPGAFLLASTLEFIRLPGDIAGRLEGRSSLGRLGLQVHATAGFVDPGFEGVLTFELINSGKLPIKVFPGMRLGQICFFHVPNVQIRYAEKSVTKYAGSVGVEFTHIDGDPEILGQTTGWYSYFQQKLTFPFTAKCRDERAISPLATGDEVEVIQMGPEEECPREIFVSIQWQDRPLAVPLSQLEPAGCTDKQTQMAVAEWRDWVAQGYEL
ncbi:MAG TPA: dCTP deaminase [Thermoguttaceae bacterium]|nr:dCTP deaminase [Thermoguttaceae bacterium]